MLHGDALRSFRVQHLKTQEEFAEYLGITVEELARLEAMTDDIDYPLDG